jgi:hypothetical protein
MSPAHVGNNRTPSDCDQNFMFRSLELDLQEGCRNVIVPPIAEGFCAAALYLLSGLEHVYEQENGILAQLLSESHPIWGAVTLHELLHLDFEPKVSQWHPLEPQCLENNIMYIHY